MIEKLPPFNLEAEESVLASLLVDPTVAPVVYPLLTAGDFFRDKHGVVFDACMTLWKRGDGINEITVAHELSRAGKLTEIGGLAFLSRILTELLTPVGAEHYAAIVARDAMYRRLIGAASLIAQMAYAGGSDSESVISKVLSSVIEATRGGDSGLVSLRDVLPDLVAQQAEILEGGVGAIGIRTGFPKLDGLIRGFLPGRMYVIGARTSTGKTGLLVHFAVECLKQGKRVLYFSAETAADQTMGARMLTQMVAGINPYGYHGSSEPLYLAQNTVQGWLDRGGDWLQKDVRRYTVQSMRAIVERERAQARLDAVFVDYAQLFTAEPPPGVRTFGTREREVAAFSDGIYEIAGGCQVPVIVAAQFNRAAEQANRRPVLSDLRESGTLEQNADVVALLYREDEWRFNDGSDDAHPLSPYLGLLDCNIAKNRQGPVKQIALNYDQSLGRFSEWTGGVPQQ